MAAAVRGQRSQCPLYPPRSLRNRPSFDRDALQLTSRIAEIPDAIVLGGAVIPEGQRAFAPLVTNLVFRPGELGVQMHQQAIALVLFQPQDMRSKDGIYE